MYGLSQHSSHLKTASFSDLLSSDQWRLKFSSTFCTQTWNREEQQLTLRCLDLHRLTRLLSSLKTFLTGCLLLMWHLSRVIWWDHYIKTAQYMVSSVCVCVSMSGPSLCCPFSTSCCSQVISVNQSRGLQYSHAQVIHALQYSIVLPCMWQ